MNARLLNVTLVFFALFLTIATQCGCKEKKQDAQQTESRSGNGSNSAEERNNGSFANDKDEASKSDSDKSEAADKSPSNEEGGSNEFDSDQAQGNGGSGKSGSGKSEASDKSPSNEEGGSNESKSGKSGLGGKSGSADSRDGSEKSKGFFNSLFHGWEDGSGSKTNGGPSEDVKGNVQNKGVLNRVFGSDDPLRDAQKELDKARALGKKGKNVEAFESACAVASAIREGEFQLYGSDGEGKDVEKFRKILTEAYAVAEEYGENCDYRYDDETLFFKF